MGVNDKKFLILWRFTEKSDIYRGGCLQKKNNILGGLPKKESGFGRFADLRGGKFLRGFDTPMCTMLSVGGMLKNSALIITLKLRVDKSLITADVRFVYASKKIPGDAYFR